MTYQTFNSELFRRFPEMKTVSDVMFDYFGDEEPGCYLTFEDILVPEIEKAAGTDLAYLTVLMAFVEEVAGSDTNCRDLVAIGLGEKLPSSKHEQIIREASGPVTRRVCRL